MRALDQRDLKITQKFGLKIDNTFEQVEVHNCSKCSEVDLKSLIGFYSILILHFYRQKARIECYLRFINISVEIVE